MNSQIMSIAIMGAAATTYVILERLFPYNRGQKLLREGFWDDFALYTGLQSYILGIIITNVILWTDSRVHLSRLSIVAGWPLLCQVIFFLVTHDLYIYLFHRLQHHSPLLWRIHEAHHSVKDVDWVAGGRSHSLEILINQTIEFAPIYLLGAAPVVLVIKATIDAIWGMWIHSNIGVKTGALQYVINGPEMHRWHHAIENDENVRNFGTKLAIWDWIFGTAFLPRDRKAADYGLTNPDYPKGYLAQHLYAFTRRPAGSSAQPKAA